MELLEWSERDWRWLEARVPLEEGDVVPESRSLPKVLRPLLDAPLRLGICVALCSRLCART